MRSGRPFSGEAHIGALLESALKREEEVISFLSFILIFFIEK